MTNFIDIIAIFVFGLFYALRRWWPAVVIAGAICWFVFPGMLAGISSGIVVGATLMIAFLAELFVFGSIGFWCLCAGILGGMIWFTDKEWPGCSILLAAATAAFFYLVYGVNPVVWALAHKQEAAMLVGGYFAVGTIWAVVRWAFWVQKLMDRLKPSIEFFETTRAPQAAVAKGTDQYKSMLLQYLNSEAINKFDTAFPPKLRSNKSRILFWIGFWPFSAIWTLINEPIKKIAHFIYNRLTGVLGWITETVIAWNLKGHI